MKIKIKKILLVSVLICIILFSICPKAFATNGNEIKISNKIGIGNTLEIISGNTSNIKSESIVDVVNYLLENGVIVNSITNNKGVSVDLTSTALIGTEYMLDTNSGNYSAIVYGDGNGDGEVDAGDMKVIIDDFLGTKKASPIAKIAVDVYQDNTLDAADLKLTLDSFLGNLKGSILNNTNASTPSPTPDTEPVGNGPQIKIGEETITLTRQNAADYYGYIVTDYVKGIESTWRLFYVDFDGKYGEPGKVYLKADPVGLEASTGSKSLNETASAGSSEALNKMKEMNPQWAQNDGIADLQSETSVLWLCDDSVWEGNYKDSDKADYVMGTPSIEMFIDSYNQYHLKKLTSGYEQIKCKWFNQEVGGYRIRYTVGDESDYRNNKNLHEDSDIMYLPTSSERVWLASPCDKLGNDNKPYVCYIYGSTGNPDISCSNYDFATWPTHTCPVVSLKSDYIPEVKYDSASNTKIRFITCWNNNTAIRVGTVFNAEINGKTFQVYATQETNGEGVVNHAFLEGTNQIKVSSNYLNYGDYWGLTEARTLKLNKKGDNINVIEKKGRIFG